MPHPFRYSRRDLLRAAGGLGVAGLLAGCGSNTGRSSGPTLSQWYHAYGEAGTQQAAQRYADAYPDADVTIQWIPGDFDAKISSGLLSSSGPDVFEYHFNYQLAKSGQVVPLDDILGDVRSDFSEIDLAATSNLFKRGHRIRLEISSSNFPRFDRNLNTGGNNFDESAGVVARNAVHHSTRHPSAITLTVVPAAAPAAGSTP